MKISELSVDYMSFDDDDKEISAIAISYKDNSGKEQRRWLEKPRRIGKWIEPSYEKIKKAGLCGSGLCRCSVCRHEEPVYEEYPKYNYCPNCGAKMDESEESKNV